MWLIRIGIIFAFLCIVGCKGSHHSDNDDRDDYSNDGDSARYRSLGRYGRYHIVVRGKSYNHYKELKEPQKREVYRFQLGMGGNFGPYEYIDPEDGVFRGFHVDLLWAVCKEAGKECYYVVDRHTNCWTVDESQQELPGVGLLQGFYEACVGYVPTMARQNSFNFSLSYTPNFAMGLYYNKGPAPPNPTDLSGRRIGFVKGWAMSRNCLSRQRGFQGNRLEDYTAVFYDNPSKLVSGLLAGEVDAIWTFKASYDPRSSEVVAYGSDAYCSLAGLSLMARYSEQPLLDWWNEAFVRMVDNGDYRKLCEKARAEHGHRGELYCME